MMSRSITRDSYVAKRPLPTITCCRTACSLLVSHTAGSSAWSMDSRQTGVKTICEVCLFDVMWDRHAITRPWRLRQMCRCVKDIVFSHGWCGDGQKNETLISPKRFVIACWAMCDATLEVMFLSLPMPHLEIHMGFGRNEIADLTPLSLFQY